jgi:hypothetical protein
MLVGVPYCHMCWQCPHMHMYEIISHIGTKENSPAAYSIGLYNHLLYICDYLTVDSAMWYSMHTSSMILRFNSSTFRKLHFRLKKCNIYSMYSYSIRPIHTVQKRQRVHLVPHMPCEGILYVTDTISNALKV